MIVERAEILVPEFIRFEAGHDVLGLFVQEWSQVMAGEERLAMLLYLVGTSRLLPKPMHAVIKGPSSGGKSEIRKQVLKFFPPEDVISFTAMSDMALVYHDRDFRHAILSMAEADGIRERARQDYFLRELMSEGKITYTFSRSVKGLGRRTATKQGPCCFLLNRLHAENETRMLTLEVSDTEEQTRLVLHKIAEVEGGLSNESPIDYDGWHLYSRC